MCKNVDVVMSVLRNVGCRAEEVQCVRGCLMSTVHQASGDGTGMAGTPHTTTSKDGDDVDLSYLGGVF